MATYPTYRSAASPVRRRHSRRVQLNSGNLFVLPYQCFLVLFGLGPAVYALITSFTNMLSDSRSFKGFQNYQSALHDFRLLPAFLHVLQFMLLWLPMMVVFVVLLALLLDMRKGPLSTLFRSLYYLPGALTGAAGVLLWIFMFDPQLSPANFLLQRLGFTSISQSLAAGNLPVVFALMVFFAAAGGWIVILYGSLQNVPLELLEAAKIDGCNLWQTAFLIKLPLIARYVIFMVILSFAGGVQLFAEPQIIFSGTMGSAGNSTWSPNQLAYFYAFTQGDFGTSAAISVFVLLIGLAIALFVIYRTDFYRIDASGK